MATSSLLSFCSITRPYRPKVWKYPQVTSQSFHHEGNSTNKVDANLSVLRERIRDLRKKERLESDCSCRLENGWEYKAKAGYDDNMNNSSSCAMFLSESIKLAGSVSSALGIVFLSGSFCILLVSFVVHLCH